MTPKFLKAIGFVLPHECEFVRGHWGDLRFVVPENVSGDAGGVTKWGIDQRSHPHLHIATLTYEQALAVYFAEWQQYRCEEFPEKIAVAQFDVRVNGGPAILWLQLALNMAARVHPRLKMDGVLGPGTMAAVQGLSEEQIRAVLVMFIRQRDLRFRNLAKTPSRAKFLNGWLQRDRDLERYLGVSAS